MPDDPGNGEVAPEQVKVPTVHTPRLLRAEDMYTPANGEVLAPLAEWAFVKYPPVFIDRPVPDLSQRGAMSKVTANAYVNYGRWVVDCPFCPSAQVVSPLDPRYLCAGPEGCANATVQGAWVQVVFPDDLELVEQALLERPSRDNRNWTSEETVEDLIAENAAMLPAVIAEP